MPERKTPERETPSLSAAPSRSKNDSPPSEAPPSEAPPSEVPSSEVPPSEPPPSPPLAASDRAASSSSVKSAGRPKSAREPSALRSLCPRELQAMPDSRRLATIARALQSDRAARLAGRSPGDVQRLTHRSLGHAGWTQWNLPRAAWLQHPAAFRDRLRIDPDDPRTLGQRAEPFQRRAAAALDPAWQLVAGRWPSDRPLPRRRFWLERPRGHSKTTDTAAMLLWVLLAARRPVRGIAAAADRDQARLLLQQMAFLARLNPELTAGLHITRDRATVRPVSPAMAHELMPPHEGASPLESSPDESSSPDGPPSSSGRAMGEPREVDRFAFDPHDSAAALGFPARELEVVSSDAASSYGTLADFLVCDELCHWSSPELWHSLYTAAAKQPHTVLAVLTNAGIGRDWRWEARERARRSHEQNGAWWFDTVEGVQASWIDRAFLEEQRAALPEVVYRRLWLNQWQARSGGFLRPEEVAACRDRALAVREAGEPGRLYVAAIDYAEKHDRTAAIVAHVQPPTEERPRPRVIVDRLDVVAPGPDQPVPVAWVEDWMLRQAAAFPGVRFIVDEHQLVGTVQRLGQRLPIERFAFAGGLGNDALARHLRTMILSGDVRWYAEAGCVETPTGEPDTLETELADLLVVPRANGRLRFDHAAGRHDDRAFVLALVCLHFSRLQAEPERFEIAPLHWTLPRSGRIW